MVYIHRHSSTLRLDPMLVRICMVAVFECHVFHLFSSSLPFLPSSLLPPSSLQLLEKDSPELFELMEEFQDKFTVVMDTLCPLMEAARRDNEMFTSQVRGWVYGLTLKYVNTALNTHLLDTHLYMDLAWLASYDISNA